MAIRIFDHGWRLLTRSHLLWINGVWKKVTRNFTCEIILRILIKHKGRRICVGKCDTDNLKLFFRQDWSRIPGEGDGEYYGEVRMIYKV